MQENIAKTPDLDLESKTTNSKGKTLAILGSILQVPVFIGLIYSINRLIDTFQMMILFFGSADPKAVAGAISIALDQIITGFLLSIPCLIIAFYVLTKTNYRSRSLFLFNIMASIFWILSLFVCINLKYLDLVLIFDIFVSW